MVAVAEIEPLIMRLPSILKNTIEVALQTQINQTSPVSGGDMSNAARLTLADDRQVIVKWKEGAISGMFRAEGRGLTLLQSANVLRIPQVLAQSESTRDSPAFIVLEWLGQGPKSRATAEALGQGLALLHRVTGERYGLDHDNFIGANPQWNQPGGNWIDFFGEHRLGFQMELAGQQGYLPPSRARLLEKLLARLDTWLPIQPSASLLHGDLWSGNWLTTDSGQPALIDPAVYYGHREAELAFTELFGGFPQIFYDAYRQTWALDPDYETRKDLYNLYHLLNHLNLFGESYLSPIDRILERFS